MDQVLSIMFGLLASYLQGSSGKELSRTTRFIIALGACMIAGFLTHGLQVFTGGGFDLNELFANMGIAFATSQGFYNTYLKNKI